MFALVTHCGGARRRLHAVVGRHAALPPFSPPTSEHGLARSSPQMARLLNWAGHGGMLWRCGVPSSRAGMPAPP